MNTKNQYCYSDDGELFSHLGDFETSNDAAMEAAEGYEPVGAFSIGQPVSYKASEFASGMAFIIFEQMACSAFDEVHPDCVADWPDASNEKTAELDALIHKWLDENVPVDFFGVTKEQKFEARFNESGDVVAVKEVKDSP